MSWESWEAEHKLGGVKLERIFTLAHSEFAHIKSTGQHSVRSCARVSLLCVKTLADFLLTVAKIVFYHFTAGMQAGFECCQRSQAGMEM